MTWYERFGLQKNPFTTNPFDADYTLVNNTKIIDDVIYYTIAGHMIVLEGPSGSGKTMMLRQIIKKFEGQGKVVYVDGSKLKKDLDIEELLDQKGRGFFGSITKTKPKNMIVLLDNVTTLSARNFEKIKYYFDQNYIRSVMFTFDHSETVHVPQSVWDRVAKRHIVIPALINFDALRIVRERFSDHFFLPDAIILELFELANHNVKKMLDYCDQVCAFVVEQGKGEVLPKYIKHAIKAEKQQTKNRVSGEKMKAEVSE
ncbi:MAG: AAA family ATPase [Candidatus Woesearchaeota archaeon]